ncbi:phosphogluconate dehydratase [Thermomonospora curvata]|uniref:Phosphogluconate dehydratase n=1 Tax=Thermomonospora curvata (strain ATCC 19995 / DSM 43183 / JCM 3096 / KCTC 9072 / NBRC 15933 / NCIMB 10081 / Henssen B9) TaxID=471852 RepID=D1AC50_THECD|nr:phosphogluconate dehydratase [Thermomonospora curvata]ACY97316.1 6-phosphogluconate dehydratase [Thermomonospora curvata DSM 43183]
MPPTLHPVVARVTERIAGRSAARRADYLARIADAGRGNERDGRVRPARTALGCANLAHGFAACAPADKLALRGADAPNIAIVTAYNDMLSAHQPLKDYPDLLKRAIGQAGGTAQVAGGVPAMCDGVTQGRAGMELSLFSRDVVAMATAVALAHDMFDGVLLLGVCDKIVPGLVIGALAFGHLPAILVPAGPMASGLPNAQKAKVRKLFAEGKATREELLEAEAASYHSPGTCTFYGTANSNQLLMEVMGLHLPGASFVPPGTALREALTLEAGRRITELTALGGSYTPVGELLDERAFVNGVVALLATGGSTNHTLHLVAMAAAAGIELTWDDFDELSAVTPLLTRLYPNGGADVNHFHAAGGTGFLIGELLEAGLLHADARTVGGKTLDDYRVTPELGEEGELVWRPAPRDSADTSVLRPVADPFDTHGGLRTVSGNLGRAVVKVSAVDPAHRAVQAPARVFASQQELQEAFRAGELDGDVVVVVRHQGPRANGMPELHKLTPPLSVLQDRGHKVALVTDGRMSGASGSVLAAIHLSPEAAAGGPLARVRDGDLIRLDADEGVLQVLVPEEELAAREPAAAPGEQVGTGRELFAAFRRAVGPAERGAAVFTS